jgi:uncharacterized membrane protein YdbT with pleckstrin-like domain
VVVAHETVKFLANLLVNRICVRSRYQPICIVAGQMEVLMSYVNQVIQPGEKLLHIASVHWIVYLPGMLLAVAALVAFGYSEFATIGRIAATVAAVLLGLGAAYFIGREWFTWWSTEIAVTNHRVIVKAGLIRRRTNEMNMEKVESVQIDQSVFGRILNYGDVTIIGTGEGEEKIKTVAAPIDLRNYVTGI